MASTNFIDGITPLQASWLNDVNSVIYNLLSVNGLVPSTLAQLKTNLGLSGMASQSASAVNISGGTMNGVVIGGTVATSATFTNLVITQTADIRSTIIQDFAGLTRRVTPTGGAFVREYVDMTAKVAATSVAQTAPGTVITFASTAGIYLGYTISGTNIAVGAVVTSVTTTTVTMSVASTAIVALGTSITFTPAVGSIEVGQFYNYDVMTNTRDVTDISFAAYFSDVGGLYNFAYSPSGTAGTSVAATSWVKPFVFDLTSGSFTQNGTHFQQFAGLTRLLTPAGGALVREYCDVAPAGGLPTTGNVEIGYSYNASINLASGTWGGRDIADIAWLHKYTDAAPYYNEVWTAASAAAGVAPAWALAYRLSLTDGSLWLGNPTGAATATPVTLDLGGTFSSVAGTNLKFKLYNTGANPSGFGISSGQVDYVGGSLVHTFYNTGSAIALKIGSATDHLLLSAGTTAIAALRLTAGVELTTPVQGAVEFDGQNIYITPSVAIGRKIFQLKNEVYNNITTVGAGTLTAAALYNGVILRTGPTAAYTDTTDTAANIIALSGAIVGSSFDVTILNGVAFAATIAAGTGVTLSGTTPTAIAASAAKHYVCVVTGPAAVTLYGL